RPRALWPDLISLTKTVKYSGAHTWSRSNGSPMPDVIIPGPAGRLEGRYRPGRHENSAIAMILHPHPQGGGHMNTQLTLALYDIFKERGFGVLRFNFRGVGRSQGSWDQGLGELSDAATALDW